MNKNIMLIPRGHDSRLQSLICGSLLIISAILPLAGCKLYGEFDNPADPGGTYRAVNRITIPESAIYCTPGEDVQISANIIPLDASRPILTWSSAYPSVATVSQTGSVHAIAIGETTITARVVPARDSDPAPTSSTRIVVNNGTVESITMPETLVIPPGGSYSIQPVLFPPNSSSRPLAWRSSNETIATVDSQGLVRATGEGSATIFCEGDGAQGSCLVEVRNAPAITFLDFVHDAGIMNYNEDTDTWPFMYMKPNTTYDMDVTWEPVDAATPTVRWFSENTNIATVDQEGIITAKGIGSTRIIASTTEGNKAVEIDVRVAQPIPVKWFSKVIIGDLWFWENIDLFCGSSLSFVPPVFPSNHEGVLSWTSSDTNLLSTDSTGIITAGDQAGSTTLRISATTTDHYRDYAVNIYNIPSDISLGNVSGSTNNSSPLLFMQPDDSITLGVQSYDILPYNTPLQASSSNPAIVSVPEWVLSSEFTITSGSEPGRTTIQVEQGDVVLSRDVIVTDTRTTVLNFEAPQANTSGSEIIVACSESVQLVPMVAPLDAVTLWSIQGGDGTATISEEGLLETGNTPTEFKLYLQSANENTNKTVKVVEGPLSTSLAIEAPGFTVDEYIYLSAGQSIQLEGVVSPASTPLSWSINDSSTGSTISANGLLTAGPYTGTFFVRLESPNQSVGRFVEITNGTVLDSTTSLAIQAPGFTTDETILVSTNSTLQLSALTYPEGALVSWSIQDLDNTGSFTITQDGLLATGSAATSGMSLRVVLNSRNDSASRYIEVINGPIPDRTDSLAIVAPGFEANETILVSTDSTLQLSAITDPQDAAVSWSINHLRGDGSVTISQDGLLSTGSTTVTSADLSVRLYSRNQYVDRYIEVIDGPILDRTENLAIVAPGFNANETILVSTDSTLQLSAITDPQDAAVSWSIDHFEGDGSVTITEDGLLSTGSTTVSDTSLRVRLYSRNQSVDRYIQVINGPVPDNTTSLAIQAPGFTPEETILVPINGTIQLTAIKTPQDAAVNWSVWNGDGSISIDYTGRVTVGTSLSGCYVRLSSRNESVDRYIQVVNGPVLGNTSSLSIQAPEFVDHETILIPINGSIQLAALTEPQEAAVTWSVWDGDDSISIDNTGRVTVGNSLSGCYVRLSSRNQYVDRYIQVIDGPVLARTDSLQITAPGFNDTENIYLPFGQELQFVADITLADPNNPLIQWSISNDSTGESSITQEGLLTAGNTATSFYIYLKSRNQSASRHVNIVDGTVTGVSITPSTLSLMPGEEYQMSGQVTPSYAVNQGLNWYSDNPTVATISSDGVITAHAAGTATMRVESQELFFTQDCALTVYDDGFRSIHNHYPALFGTSYYEVDSSSDGNHIVVASGNGVLVSHDRGNTWIRGAGTEDKSFSRVSSSDDGTTIVAIYSQNLYGSFDNGTTWTVLTSAASRSWTDVTVSGDGSVIAACASSSYIFESRDDGTSWTKLSQNTASWRQIHINSEGNHVQAIIDNSPTIYSFTYATGIWTTATISLEDPNGFIQELYPTDSPDTVRVRGYSPSTGYTLFATENGGSIWTNQLSIDPSYDSFSINRAGKVWLHGKYSSSNNLQWSVDGGSTIIQTERGMPYWKRCHVSKDGSLLIYANLDYCLFWIHDRNL